MWDNHRKWVLGYVESLVEFDRRPWLEIERELYNPCVASTHNQKEIVAANLVRTAYGGLKQDPPMISVCLDWLIKEGVMPVINVTRWDREK